jgi:SAM-dependent methyltransferase
MKNNNDDRQAVKQHFHNQLTMLKEATLPFRIVEAFRYNNGPHPESFEDIECMFAASNIRRHRPQTILDVGSYKHFVKGLFAAYDVTSLDVRARFHEVPGFKIITGDAKKLRFPDNFFDAVVLLCAIEHFGLGRYGDDFDLDADSKAAKEFIRVIKPGGLLTFSTTIKRGIPVLAFNAHRIYTYEMIHSLCDGLTLEEELFYSRSKNRRCSLDEISDSNTIWDIYCGAWRKPE